MISRIPRDKVVVVVMVSVLTFITLSTSAMALNKILGSFGQEKDQIEQGFTPTSTEKAQGGSLSVTVKPTDNVTQSISAPTQINISISPTGSSIINSKGCIVAIFGKQYDVITLRSTHSGGDVFVCGTDMTAVYQDRHGTSVNLIAPYLVTGGSALGAQNPAGATGSENKDSYKGPYREIEDEDD